MLMLMAAALAVASVVLDDIRLIIVAIAALCVGIILAFVGQHLHDEAKWCTGHMEYVIDKNETVVYDTPSMTKQRVVLQSKVCTVMVP
jgi:lipopolysaccharide export system protein LptC